jgi:geranylgeranyl diphosphate synthase type I
LDGENALADKLRENAIKIDAFIEGMLTPKKPEVLYEASRHIVLSGGKHLRPYLVMKSCEVVGGDPESAIPYASALELLHNFTLVHDDVMDHDEIRRGRPTVHVKWGVPIAIASGDFLFAKVFQAMVEPALLGKLSSDRAIECVKRVTDATIALCEGQVLDMSYPANGIVNEEDYLEMVGGKTASLFRACAETGAIVGGGRPEEVDMLGSFAWNAGIGFQIVDDVLCLTADEKTLGKPAGSDIREGKKTLIVVHALSNASPEQLRFIKGVLGVNNASQQDIELAIGVLSDTGSIDYAMERALEYREKALEMVMRFPESPARSELVEMVDYFINRTY